MSLIDKLWYRPNWYCYALWPFAQIFKLITWLRRKAYRIGLFKIKSSRLPVIVVGNLSVGGNGKTPVVIHLVEQLRKQGYFPGVVSRGYGGNASFYPYFVSAQSSPAECGDEPFLIYNRCNCPVAVDPTRENAVDFLVNNARVDVIISDDGLQHYSMDRQLELVVVDGARRFGNGCVLPMGPLREGIWRLEQVDGVICNGQGAQSGEYAMTVVPGILRRVNDFTTLLEDPVYEEPVVALAGIGNPDNFFTSLEKQGFQLFKKISLPDHAPMSKEQLGQLLDDWPGLVIMTEKDAVKCRPFALDNWYYLPIDAQIDESLIKMISQKLQAKDQA